MNLKLKISLSLVLMIGVSVYIYRNNNDERKSTNAPFPSAKTKRNLGPKDTLGLNLKRLNSNAPSRNNTAGQLQLTQKDLETITATDIEFPQFASALMRLSTQRNPKARDTALSLLASKDRRMSHIAFRALGYFDDEIVNPVLGKILTSDDPAQKRNAIQALAWNPKVNSGRKVILEGVVASPKVEMLDSLMAMGALYKMTAESSQKENYFERVLTVAKKTQSPSEKFMATRMLMQMDSKSLVARELMTQLEEARKKKINKNQPK